MDVILGQNLAFDLARNLVASFAIHLAEFLTILLYFDFSLNHDQQHNFCLQDTTLNHLCAALALLQDTTLNNFYAAPTR